MNALNRTAMAELLRGIDEIECVTPDLNGVPRGKVMTAEGFLEGRRLQLARGVLLQCIMGGYPAPRFYGSDDGDLALNAAPGQVYRLPWSDTPRALAICDADELDGRSSGLSTRGLLKRVLARYAEHGWQAVVATELEFFVCAPNPDPRQPFQPPLGLDGRREEGAAAFSVSSNNGLRPFFNEVYACMAALGLPRDTFMHEMGVSQFEINLLFAPHVNSYQRLCQPFASPNNACWSEDNRAAGLRIPASAPVARRVENRLPGADANPYLALAASLAAGLHGIERQLQPSAPIQGEFEVPDELTLPCTMHAAIERLKRSQLARELFGEEFVAGYLASKTLELASFQDEITPWERRVLAAQV